MRLLPALLAALLLTFVAVPAAATAGASTSPDCAGPVCDAINRVCNKVGGADCVGASESEATVRCVGLPCDVINAVCNIVLKRHCVA